MTNRIFLDTEFIELPRGVDLISIGMVKEDGSFYYAQRAQCDFSKANVWVKGHVIPELQWCAEGLDQFSCASLHEDCVWKLDNKIRADIIRFVGAERPQFWGYYADYDWVAICQLFGKMIDLPKGWPMFAFDIKQLCVEKGDPQLPAQGTGEHNALMDARWNLQAWKYLQDRSYV